MEESKLKELPTYDFSGPAPNLGSGANVEDDSLVASDDSLQNAADEAANSTTMSGQKVYLVPLYCGMESTSYLARNSNGYKIIAGSENATYDTYKKKLASFKKGSYTANDGIGRSYFKGKAATYSKTGQGVLKYNSWVLAWNACYSIGSQLAKDGCTVNYAYSGTRLAKGSDTPNAVFGDTATRSFQQIADDIALVQPDYVIVIGFNEGDYGKVTGTPKTKNTLVTYLNYSKIKNNKFASSIRKNWKSVSDLMTALPADKSCKVTEYTGSDADTLGLQKMQTALYALQVSGYKGKSAGIMLGTFNTNLQSGGSYSYQNPTTLYSTLSSIIEKSL